MSASQPQPRALYFYDLTRSGLRKIKWISPPGLSQPVFSLDSSKTRALVFALYYYSLNSASSTGTFIPVSTIFSSLQNRCPLLDSLGIGEQHLSGLLHFIRRNTPFVTVRRGPNGGVQLHPDLSGYLHNLLLQIL